MMQWCEWCQVDAGRTNASRACCRARSVAGMMMSARLELYQRLEASKGKEAADTLKHAVFEYMARKLALGTKEDRVKAYRQAAIEGSMDDVELLKRLTKEEYERQVRA